MIRKFALGATIAVAMTTALLAAERATFVLTDGSRHSGDVVFHGGGNRNIIDNQANLAENGQEHSYSMDQLALIDFSGDQPSIAEFQQLPAESGNLLVLRNGYAQQGRLMNIVNGTTVQWQNASGQTQDYAVHDVSRIYLNPSAARRIYPQFASVAPAPAAAATSGIASGVGTDSQPVPAGSVRVPANQQWVPTGVTVKKGQRLAFAASGEVHFSPDPSHVANADGNPNVQTAGVPVPAMSVGGLIGRVGNSAPFPIGSNRQPIAMPDDGQLMLAVNDTNVNDNTGSFVVQILPVAGR
jgi:hypothetical protein